MTPRPAALLLVSSLLVACAGMKVVDPNKPKTEGTLQLDLSGGKPRLVGTHTCTLVAANGKRVYATDKTEKAARKEAIARCQDQTTLSFCKASRMSCSRN